MLQVKSTGNCRAPLVAGKTAGEYHRTGSGIIVIDSDIQIKETARFTEGFCNERNNALSLLTYRLILRPIMVVCSVVSLLQNKTFCKASSTFVISY